jgi:ACT domain-containing protein
MASGITKSLVLGENYKISPTDDIIAELKKLDCIEDIELIYSSI